MSNKKVHLEDFVKDNRFELKKYLTSLFKQFNHFQRAQLNVCNSKESDERV
ncbi:hypothetical protein [Bacillus sp. Marseille-P3661]|uniref:hypothetical protein n=1 Tax=Bacillus sp. Marseille-P3661 TaxID=1936234 RepID=UPI0015E1AFEA|nr:hypothetical protein [Bacillus sp. Marseille-P3661]